MRFSEANFTLIVLYDLQRITFVAVRRLFSFHLHKPETLQNIVLFPGITPEFIGLFREQNTFTKSWQVDLQGSQTSMLHAIAF